MQVPFTDVFQINADGSVSPKTKVNIGGVVMTPGVRFTGGVSFSGVDLAAHVGKDLEIDRQGDTVVIKAVYQ